MIKINILKEENNINHIEIFGHAHYDKYGKDIVCAAVSSIITTSVNGILSINETIKAVDDKKTITIDVLKHNEVTDKLLDNMIHLLKGIESQYPKNISIRTEEKDVC